MEFDVERWNPSPKIPSPQKKEDFNN